MVRLKDATGLQTNAKLTFQFHYGTIKRFQWFYDNIGNNIFQFHYGTIKSYDATNITTI